MRRVRLGGDRGQRVAGLDDVLLSLRRRRLGQGAAAEGADRQRQQDQQVSTAPTTERARTARRRRTRGEGAGRAGGRARRTAGGGTPRIRAQMRPTWRPPRSNTCSLPPHWSTNTCSLSMGGSNSCSYTLAPYGVGVTALDQEFLRRAFAAHRRPAPAGARAWRPRRPATQQRTDVCFAGPPWVGWSATNGCSPRERSGGPPGGRTGPAEARDGGTDRRDADGRGPEREAAADPELHRRQPAASGAIPRRCARSARRWG